MNLTLNKKYLNKTPHKTMRNVPAEILGALFHETAGTGSNEWGLDPASKVSWNYLIERDGQIFHYLDEKKYIAWHAGDCIYVLRGRVFEDAAVSACFIGVEVEGPNDGTPITAAQQASLVQLVLYFKAIYGIEPLAANYPTHAQVALPQGRKRDPRGFNRDYILTLAKPTAPPTDISVIGVGQGLSLAQFKGALNRNGGQAHLSDGEMDRLYRYCSDFGIAADFIVALWLREGGRPLGSSELQHQTKNAGNIKMPKVAGRSTITHNGSEFLVCESFMLSLLYLIFHLKNYYGAQGITSVVQITQRFAPATDGNDPAAYARSVIEDMIYMRSR